MAIDETPRSDTLADYLMTSSREPSFYGPSVYDRASVPPWNRLRNLVLHQLVYTLVFFGVLGAQAYLDVQFYLNFWGIVVEIESYSERIIKGVVATAAYLLGAFLVRRNRMLHFVDDIEHGLVFGLAAIGVLMAPLVLRDQLMLLAMAGSLLVAVICVFRKYRALDEGWSSRVVGYSILALASPFVVCSFVVMVTAPFGVSTLEVQPTYDGSREATTLEGHSDAIYSMMNYGIWEDLDYYERLSCIGELASVEAANLGITEPLPKIALTCSLRDGVVGSYSHELNTLYLSLAYVTAQTGQDTVSDVAHEFSHVFQHQVVDTGTVPADTTWDEPVTTSTIELWASEFDDYKDSDNSSYEEYYVQGVEASARRHAEIATYDYMRDLLNMGYRFDLVYLPDPDSELGKAGEIGIEEAADASSPADADEPARTGGWALFPGVVV